MLPEYDQCYCTVTCSEDKLTGKTTQMEHKGEGVFCCPKCNRILDISKSTYKVRLKFYKEGDDMGIKVIEPFDKRLMIPVQEQYPKRLNKDALEDDLSDDFPWATNDYILNHKMGIFDILMFWEWDSYYTDCGTEWDLEMFIIEEHEVK